MVRGLEMEVSGVKDVEGGKGGLWRRYEEARRKTRLGGSEREREGETLGGGWTPVQLYILPGSLNSL